MLSNFSIAKYPIGYSTRPTIVVNDAISFNGYGLQNEYICTSEANFEDAGSPEYNSYPIPRADGNGFLSRFWRKKTIVLSGTVKMETKEELEQKIDEMKKNLYPTEGKLQYITANGARNITATLVGASFERKGYNITFCPFTITFETNEAFWYDIINESYSASGKTASYTETITNNGTAPAFAKVYFSIISATSTTSISFNANGKTITASATFTAGDVLEINGETKEVKINSTIVDYDGTFPELNPGENIVSFIINWTFSTDIVVAWRKNYL